MCVVCEMVETLGSSSYSASSATGFACTGADSSATNTTTVGSTSTQSINGLLSGYKWAVTNLTYSFPSTVAPYGNYAHTATSGSVNETLSFSAATALAQISVREAMKQVSAVTGLTVTENFGDVTANIRVGESSLLPAAGGPSNAAAYAYYPSGFFKGGDVWLGPSANYDSPFVGSIGWRSIWHELGHALGLKHAHDSGGVASTPVPAARNSHEYTVMTYYSYVGGPTGYPNEFGGHPQTFMMDDIRALQQMYGADFTSAEAKTGNTVYKFSSTTGQMTIQETSNGTTTTTQELAPGVNRILRTLWDGGGIDTYDFSNYTTNMTINLQPGEWSTLSAVQLANLGNNNFARGNLANALQFNNDARSLIENANGGAGDDSMTGNAAANVLNGGGGNDTFFASIGNDTLSGGAGANRAIYSSLGTANLSVNLDAFAGTVLKAGGVSGQDTLSGIQTITATNGNNTFVLKNGVYTVNGGTGNDTYYLDNAADVINDAGGFDVVLSTASFTAAANIELIQLDSNNTICTSTATTGYVIMDARGSGTTLNGSTANNIYVINNTSTTISDTGGTNTLISYAASFTLGANLNIGAVLANNASLTGNNAGNVLQHFGTGGTLIGGAGNDLFQVASNSTVIQDTAGGGFDVIWSVTSDYTLANNVEQLIVLQANGTGRSNASGGQLFAGQSNVTLVSGTGNDLMYGNGLDAIFKFNAGFGHDVINGFTAHAGTTVNDRIDLSSFGLSGMGAITLTAGLSGATQTTTVSINGYSGHDIVLYGISASSLSALDFMF